MMKVKVKVHFLLYGYSHVLSLFGRKDYQSPTKLPIYFCQKSIDHYVWVYFWILYFVPMIYISIFMPKSHYLDQCSFIASLEVRQQSPPNFFLSSFFLFLVKTALAIPGLLLSTLILDSGCQFLQEPDGILIRISSNL